MALQDRVVEITMDANGVSQVIGPQADLKSLQVVASGNPDGTWTVKKSNLVDANGVPEAWVATDITGVGISEFLDGLLHDAKYWQIELATHTQGSYRFGFYFRG